MAPPDGHVSAAAQAASGNHTAVLAMTGGMAAFVLSDALIKLALVEMHVGQAVALRGVCAGAAAAPDEAAALVRELRKRTRETELWAEMERERRARHPELDLRIEVDPADAGDPAPAAGSQVLPK